jgi:two-component system LytT family sensor kinase
MLLTIAQLQKACVLVTLTLLLTRTRLFRDLCTGRIAARDRATVVLLLLLMGIAEVYVVPTVTPLNIRIVSAAVAGLIAGPWVGFVIGLAVTAFSCAYNGYSPLAIGPSMLAAGLIGGLIHRRRPEVALHPFTGFALGFVTNLARDGGIALSGQWRGSFFDETAAALAQGCGVALVLFVIQQVRRQEAQARAAAMAEVRELQARMEPHFLFNALNTIAALSRVDPKAVPKAAARLGLFLRASLDQNERSLIRLGEEMEVVRAYLDVEGLRLGDRLRIREEIAADVMDALVPPFILQPLVENAVRHGIQSRRAGGFIEISAESKGCRLAMAVYDSGDGMAPETKSRLFDSDGMHSHALGLMPRRLKGLYGGGAFSLSVDSASGDGTTVRLSIPLQFSDDARVRGYVFDRSLGLSQREGELTIPDLCRAYLGKR